MECGKTYLLLLLVEAGGDFIVCPLKYSQLFTGTPLTFIRAGTGKFDVKMRACVVVPDVAGKSDILVNGLLAVCFVTCVVVIGLSCLRTRLARAVVLSTSDCHVERRTHFRVEVEMRFILITRP